MGMKVVEHNNLIYFEAEQLINVMIDNVTNAGLELDVYGDELTKEQWIDAQENIRGYAAAIKVIIDAYSELTPLAERAEFMLMLSEQITNILEAPRAEHL
jgi:hypothetical protein